MPKILQKSGTGATHKRKGIECQDFAKYEAYNEVAIIAVADGHGSDRCPYSLSGAKIAVNSFDKVIQELLNIDEDFLSNKSKWDGLKIAEKVVIEWQKRVIRSYCKKKDTSKESLGIEEKGIYKLYGTTLLGIVFMPDMLFVLQIGDGNITLVSNNQIVDLIDAERLLGTDTYSLSNKDAWNYACYKVYDDINKANDRLFILSTDGFYNSHKTQEEYEKSCRGYYRMIKEYGFEAVCENIPEWLKETSEMGCGDDITVALAYYETDEAMKSEVTV